MIGYNYFKMPVYGTDEHKYNQYLGKHINKQNKGSRGQDSERKKTYRQILMARPIVALSNKDIGFLPGDAKEKITPYMEPLYDNLKFIRNQYSERDREYQNIKAALENEKIVISPLAYIRGRSIYH